MKFSWLIIFIFLPSVATPETLVRVEDTDNPCEAYGCMYYEWKLTPFDDIRFIASGYEDGIDYGFYKVSELGEYELLLQVNPIIVDSDGHYWWGYPWAISDIARFESPCGLYISATFDHSIVRDGIHSIPEWQKRLPAVLFIAKDGEWVAEQKELNFKPAKLEELKVRASED